MASKRIGSEDVASTHEDIECYPTHVKLVDFAVKMGYTGKIDIEVFKKLCAGRMSNIFEHLIASVHPAPEVEARKKYEFLRRVKQSDEIQGSSSKQYDLAKENRELKNALSEKYKILEEKEKEAQEMKQRMLKLCNEAQLQMRRNEDINKKTMLLKLHKGVLGGMLNRTEDLVARTSELTKFRLGRKEHRSSEVKDILNKCQETVGVFLKHCRTQYLESGGSLDSQSVPELQEEKQELKDLIEKSFLPFSAQELVEVVVQTQQELNMELKNMVDSVDLQNDADQIRTKFDIPASHSRCPGLVELALMHIKSDAECSQLRKICAAKQKQLALLEEELINHPQESTVHVNDVKRRLIKLRLLHVALIARNKSLSEELKKPNLKELGYLRWIIQKQRADICSLEAERSGLLSFIMQNRSEAPTFQQHVLDQKKVLSKLESFDLGSFETLQGRIDRLKGTIREEIKLFDETPLYCLHTISQDGFQIPVPTFKMLVNYGYAEGGPLHDYGAPAKPVEETVLRLFQEKCYRSLLQLAESEDQSSSLPLIQTRVKEYKELESSLSDKCLELQGLLLEFGDSSESDREEVINCLNTWLHLPFASAIPCSQRLGGKTFSEWLNLYDCKMFENEIGSESLDSTS